MPPIPSLMPIGIIETHEQEESYTFLRLPVDHDKLNLDSEVVVWNFHNNALAKCRGIVTELTGDVGSVKITEQNISDTWPEGVDPFGYANPVYIAGLPEECENDVYQPLQTLEMMVPDKQRMELLTNLSAEHQETAGINPAYATIMPQQALLEEGFYEEEHE